MAYADLRTDYAFRKVFGGHAHVLQALLNDLLEREGARAITSLEYLPGEQAPLVMGMKLSVLDVRCRTGTGETFVVEMQVLPVTGFLNRVVYNACKAYVGALQKGRGYGELVDVVAVSICDFELWPDAEQTATGQPRVPLLSRWRMVERHDGAEGLGQVQYVFLELPKLGKREPRTPVEWWASLFRTAPMLDPEEVARTTDISAAQREALALANAATWSSAEQDAYYRAFEEVDQVVRMVSTARTVGHAEGRAEGEAMGVRQAIVDLCEVLGIEITAGRRADLDGLDRTGLAALREHLKRTRTWEVPPTD